MQRMGGYSLYGEEQKGTGSWLCKRRRTGFSQEIREHPPAARADGAKKRNGVILRLQGGKAKLFLEEREEGMKILPIIIQNLLPLRRQQEQSAHLADMLLLF